MQRDIFINYITADFPDSIKALTTTDPTNEQEKYCLAINSNQDDIHQAAAFLHEALHIYHQDFIGEKRISSLEATRRKELIDILNILIDEEQDFC